MLERSNKRFKPAEDGDNVNVPIPEVDRGRLDPANFTAVVQNHNEETGLFTLGTKVGTLKTQFSRNQFELLTQKFLTTDDVPENVEVGVREAARLHSNTGGQGFFKCSCQTKCQSKRCKCNRDGVKCNSRCHKNRSCQNHDNVLIWTIYWNQILLHVFSLSISGILSLIFGCNNDPDVLVSLSLFHVITMCWWFGMFRKFQNLVTFTFLKEELYCKEGVGHIFSVKNIWASRRRAPVKE